jgi:hypothetical protein
VELLIKRCSLAAALLLLSAGVCAAETPARAGEDVHARSVNNIESLPADLPLPASPPLDAAWLREANILQPYGHSAYVFLTDKDRPARLKRELGFNVVIVQPTDSHNTIAKPEDKLTDEQFRAGLARCRAAGYHILLYTSVMAFGLSPEFQSGQIAREHPDWQQRDPKGNPVLVWGVPWLCPNSGARQLALERALRIAREYDVDGVMLDNNQFFFAAAGWTCHCGACTAAFREYVQKRFGVNKSRQLFGAAPNELTIPTEEGPLYAVWLHWRNRVWAEVNESFRAKLREQNPNLMLFANTQYKWDDGMLASDLQFEREDVVLSESVGLNSRQMSEKMVLGQAIAAGRPLWNYVGTFSKGDDYTGMLPENVVTPMIAATLAHAACPWIVDGFDDGPTDPKSRAAMAELLLWHSKHEDLFNQPRWSAVAAILSLDSRNLLHKPLIPPHITSLQTAGVPVIALRDDNLTAAALKPFRVVTVETAACLNGKAIAALAEWARAGGTLIAKRDTGDFDELGRKLPQSRFWQALGINGPPPAPHAANVGRGRVIAPDDDSFAEVATTISYPYSRASTDAKGVEIVPYESRKSLLFHVLRHETSEEPITLRLRFKCPSAKLFAPGRDGEALPLEHSDSTTTLCIDHAPPYSVVEIRLR